MVKNPPTKAEATGDAGSYPGLGRSLEGEARQPTQDSRNSMDCIGQGNPLQYSREFRGLYSPWGHK